MFYGSCLLPIAFVWPLLKFCVRSRWGKRGTVPPNLTSAIRLKEGAVFVAVLAYTLSTRTLQRGGQHPMLGGQPLTRFPHSKLLCYWETSLRLSIWTCVLWHLRLCSYSHKLSVKITSTSRTWLPTCVGRHKRREACPFWPPTEYL